MIELICFLILIFLVDLIITLLTQKHGISGAVLIILINVMLAVVFTHMYYIT